MIDAKSKEVQEGKIPLGIIKAGVGGYVGHSSMPPRLIEIDNEKSVNGIKADVEGSRNVAKADRVGVNHHGEDIKDIGWGSHTLCPVQTSFACMRGWGNA